MDFTVYQLVTTLWLAHIRSRKWKPLFEETYFTVAEDEDEDVNDEEDKDEDKDED